MIKLRMVLVVATCAVACVSCASQPPPGPPAKPSPDIASFPAPVPLPVVTAPRAPLTAVGRINRQRGGFCSGVLIAPDKVLTTAHCLWDGELGRWTTAADLHFQAGYHLGSDLVHRRGTAIDLPSGMEMTPQGLPRRAEDDWAVLTLDHPVGIESAVRPVALALLEDPVQPRALGALLRVGYGPRQPHALASARCKAIASLNPSILLHDCGATFAETGFPILVETADGWRVLGLQAISRNATAVPNGLGMMLLVNALAGPHRTVRW